MINRPVGRKIRAIWRLFLFKILTAFVVGTQTLLLPFYRGPASYLAPQLWHKGVQRIFNIKVTAEGAPASGRQTMFVANHLSYLDIPVLGRFVRGAFVARGDMSEWPFVGYMAKMQQTVFVSRARKDAAKDRNQLERVLKKGGDIMIFAEGTSSNGADVLPFKSSLFSLALQNAERKALLVQPVTISLLSVDGKPADNEDIRDLYAWHGDMTLTPHIWAFAQLSGATVHLKFHPPRDAAGYDNRKTLCKDCWNDVRNGLRFPSVEQARAA